MSVVGGGLAAANAAEQLRSDGYSDGITLVGAEDHLPYERSPLSKDLLLGSAEPDSVFAHDVDWYAAQEIEVVSGAQVTGIDLAARSVTLGDRTLPHEKLLLATGARSRRLAAADASGAPVAYLRTLEESATLKEHLADDVLVVGAGWIGLELASAIRQAGGSATIVEAAPLPLAVLGEEMGEVLADLHRSHGVDLHLGTSLESVEHDGSSTTVRLSDGHVAHPDLVDGRLQTSDPHVFAAGDVANHDHPTVGRVRVEHWDNAIHQGRHAATSMLGGRDPYDKQPFFFSDEYDLGMEYIGHVGAGHDEVVIRGDRETRVLNVVWISGGIVVAGMHTNDWDAADSLRAWIGREADDRLRDASIPLADTVG